MPVAATAIGSSSSAFAKGLYCVHESLLDFAWPDAEGLADGEGGLALAEHGQGFADIFEPDAEPGDGAEFGG